jgi:hypothetical protein
MRWIGLCMRSDPCNGSSGALCVRSQWRLLWSLIYSLPRRSRVMQRRILFILAGIALVGVMAATGAWAQSEHFVREPTCVLSNDCSTVTCSGKIGGLGQTPTAVSADIANSGCVNRGGHEPPGHVQAGSEPITPKGGSITFRVEVSLSCPSGQEAVFGDEACIFVTPVGGTPTQVDDCITILKPTDCP